MISNRLFPILIDLVCLLAATDCPPRIKQRLTGMVVEPSEHWSERLLRLFVRFCQQ